MARIDLAAVDRESFTVSERPNGLLIVPQKSKHVWADEELHLRSLLVDREGYVRSSGFPKFGNYGENPTHDEEFRLALQRGAVQFSEKLDGTLIIADYQSDLDMTLRTRGNHDLGDFAEPVWDLIEGQYENFYQIMGDSVIQSFLDSHSLLFEYIAPTNRIVLRYDEPALVLLGYVNKDTLLPGWDEIVLQYISGITGIPVAPVLDLPTDFDALMPFVRNWTDKEGVVARFVTLDGRPMMLKIKASQYLKLHAVKFKLEGKVAKLAALLGIRDPYEAAEKLYDFGVDFEAQTFVKPELDAYFMKLKDTTAQFESLRWMVKQIKAKGLTVPTGEPPVGDFEWANHYTYGEKEHRKEFVRVIKAIISRDHYPASFFNAAMKLYDGQDEEAWLSVLAAEVLQENWATVRNWLKNPQVELDAMMAVPVVDE